MEVGTMPVYEFTCEECGEEFSVLVRRMGDEAPCPECHSADVRRRMSGFASSQGSSGSKRFVPT